MSETEYDYPHFLDFLSKCSTKLKFCKSSVDSDFVMKINTSMNNFKNCITKEDELDDRLVHKGQARLIKVAYALFKVLSNVSVSKIPHTILLIPMQLLDRYEFTNLMVNEIVDIHQNPTVAANAMKMETYSQICIAYRDLLVIFFSLVAKNLSIGGDIPRSTSVPFFDVCHFFQFFF